MQKTSKKLEIWFLILCLIPGLGTFSKAHGFSVSGKIQVEGNKSLKNLVVYLAPEEIGQIKSSSRKHNVTQKGRNFKPRLLVVFNGDLVQWINNEDKEIDHNIYSLSSIASFDLGLGDKGSVLKQDFKKTGTFNYFCSVHKKMEGKLVVLPSRHFAILEKPGSFVLTDVTPGKWKLKTVVSHRRYWPETVPIIIGNQDLQDLVLKIQRKK